MISSTMTRLLVRATPRSPCRAPSNQFQYRRWGGTSKPSSLRKTIRASGVAPCPRTADATSPGRICVQMKISTETANKVNIPSSSRFTINRVIGRDSQEKARFFTPQTAMQKARQAVSSQTSAGKPTDVRLQSIRRTSLFRRSDRLPCRTGPMGSSPSVWSCGRPDSLEPQNRPCQSSG